MDLEERIKSFSILGKNLREALSGRSGPYSEELNDLIESQHLVNPWFTSDNVRAALDAIAFELTEENLIQWTSAYPAIKEDGAPLKAGVIMAGNIPLAGFHDFLSVLISGNKLIAKISSKDPRLIVFISKILFEINPDFRTKIEFTSGTMTDFDAVIATGSNNSSRYFEYYFGKYPNIIRKNRNSIAILDGSETPVELKELGKDIFTYFGLGCRNVSKIYIPEGYDLTGVTSNWESFSGCIYHQKYSNNYDFNKAVYLVNKESFYDAGYILIKEEVKLASPVSVLHYEFYKSLDVVKKQTELLKEKIQCIAGKQFVPFGKTQSPHLWDYADGVDTLEFLLKKKLAGIL